MGLLRPRKADPISERSRALTAEIASLEAQIRELAAHAQPGPAGSAQPGESPSPRETIRVDVGAPPSLIEPVFEQVDHQRVTAPAPSDATAPRGNGHFNELGVRKYDLLGAWRRVQRHLQGPAATNPKLINYLAAGSIQGLRPLRYEKRVARNRVLALAALLLFVLWGLISVLNR